MLIGIFAAELRVKNAGIALSFRQNQTRGYGFCLISTKATKGYTTKSTTSMVPTNRNRRRPYCVNPASPVEATESKTSPAIPKGAIAMTN